MFKLRVPVEVIDAALQAEREARLRVHDTEEQLADIREFIVGVRARVDTEMDLMVEKRLSKVYMSHSPRYRVKGQLYG